MPSTTEDEIKSALSANRVDTYEQAKGLIKAGLVRPLSLQKALELYAWNAQISAAFMHPLHICEVVVRNGVCHAIEQVYGANWPWSPGFEQSLPNPSTGYSMRRDLFSARQGQPSTGKVIPELKFVFWQKMFTSRYDARLWNPHFTACFPNFPAGTTPSVGRKQMYDALEDIRKLRNRIAHHEPIFARNLVDDFNVIAKLISWRCPATGGWMAGHQQVSFFLANRPI